MPKILKERDIPLRIILNDILLRRLPKEYKMRKEIEEDLAKRKAGLRGEQNLSYHLTFLPEGYDIIHDIRLINEHGFAFQIDTLILTPFFILILEVKNMLGTLKFDYDSKQFTRTYNQKEEGFSNPIVQAERHHSQLQKWIQANKLPLLPIEHVVVVSHPSSIITSNRNEIYKKVFHAEHLPNKTQMIKKRYNSTLDKKEYRKLIRMILKNHTPLKIDIFKTYGIDPKEIQTGVQCSRCHFIPMGYQYGNWHCLRCQTASKTAYQKAVEDFLYLYDSGITNQQAREFLHLSSRHLTRRLLLEMNLKQSGKTKCRVYHW